VPPRSKAESVCRKREKEASDRRASGINRRPNSKKGRAFAAAGPGFGLNGRRFDPTWEHLLQTREQISKRGEHPWRTTERPRRTGTIMSPRSAASVRSGPGSEGRIGFRPADPRCIPCRLHPRPGSYRADAKKWKCFAGFSPMGNDHYLSQSHVGKTHPRVGGNILTAFYSAIAGTFTATGEAGFCGSAGVCAERSNK
jgi:hypothetical protein